MTELEQIKSNPQLIKIYTPEQILELYDSFRNAVVMSGYKDSFYTYIKNIEE
jgi:hypothetical protein